MRYLSTENCLTTFSIVIHVLNCIITLSVSSEIIIKLTWNYYYLKKNNAIARQGNLTLGRHIGSCCL
jgi:hypothetical protein